MTVDQLADNDVENAKNADASEDAEISEDTALDADPGQVTPEVGGDGAGPRARRMRTVASHWRSITVVMLLVGATALAVVLYLTQFRPDQQTGPTATAAVVDAASSGTVALLTYAPDTLDRDVESAQKIMTGDFSTYYSKFTADVVAPAVRDKGITAEAQVRNAALMEMHPDTAKVLLFLNQQTVSRDRPEPALTVSSVIVSLTKVDGKWMISALDPV